MPHFNASTASPPKSPTSSETSLSTTLGTVPGRSDGVRRSLLDASDESRTDLRQEGALLTQPDEVGKASELEKLKSEFELLRKVRAACTNGLGAELFSEAEKNQVLECAGGLDATGATSQALHLFDRAKRRGQRAVWGRVVDQGPVWILTRSDVRELQRCRTALFSETNLHNDILHIYATAKERQAHLPAEQVGDLPDRLEETKAIQVQEDPLYPCFPLHWVGPFVDVGTTSPLRSAVEFWSEYGGEEDAPLSVMVIDDIDDVKALVNLEVVQEAIKAQDDDRVNRDWLSRGRMGRWE